MTADTVWGIQCLVAANAFDFATGLRLVQKQGALMAEAKGGMACAISGVLQAKVRWTRPISMRPHRLWSQELRR